MNAFDRLQVSSSRFQKQIAFYLKQQFNDALGYIYGGIEHLKSAMRQNLRSA